MVSLVGGEVDEAELPLLEPESVLWNLMAGLAEYEAAARQAAGGVWPTALWIDADFAANSVSAWLPRCRSFHARRWPIPPSRRRKIALGRARRDGHRRSVARAARRQSAGKFFGAGRKIGPRDGPRPRGDRHVCPLAGARQNVLRRSCGEHRPMRRCSANLSRWKTISPTRVSSGSYSKFSADQYRTPYLQQAIERGKPDALSRWVRHQRRCRTADACQTIATLVSLLRGSDATSGDLRSDDLRSEIERGHSSGNSNAPEADLDQRLAERLSQAVAQLSVSLPREKKLANADT